MRVRRMNSAGDMTFGQGSANFIIDEPAAVAQLVLTRLKLWTNQWFLDLNEGTPYSTQILGKNSKSTYDNAILTRLLETNGVVSILAYQSSLNDTSRLLTWSATLQTQYGTVQFTNQLSVTI